MNMNYVLSSKPRRKQTLVLASKRRPQRRQAQVVRVVTAPRPQARQQMIMAVRPPKPQRQKALQAFVARPSSTALVPLTRSRARGAGSTDLVNHARFAAGLIHPATLVCRKWPQPIPVPTFSTKWSGSFTYTANATGNMVVWLQPPTSTTSLAIYGANAAAVTATSLFSTWTGYTVVDSPSFLSNFNSIRMVSAELSISDTTAALNRSGKFFVGSVVFDSVANNSFSIGVLRDAFYQHNSDTMRPLKSIAIPMDTSAGEWISNRMSWSVPVVAVTGGVPNGTYTIDYHVNLEAIPGGANSDLLSTEPSQPGNVTGALSAAGQYISNGFSSIARSAGNILIGGAGRVVTSALHSITNGLAYADAGGPGRSTRYITEDPHNIYGVD